MHMENINTETVLFSLPLARLEPIFKSWVRDVITATRPDPLPAPDPERWMNLQELCEYLPEKPKVQTVYSWVSNSLIPVNKKGKRLYFLKSDIDTWLKSGRRKTFAELQAETSKRVR